MFFQLFDVKNAGPILSNKGSAGLSAASGPIQSFPDLGTT